jgi:arylsulfatase A-like enzyme
MAQQAIIESLAAGELREAVRAPNQVALCAWVAFATIVALLSSSLEIELLEQVDSLSRYMTYQEIALDFGAALLLLLGIAFLWWLSALLIAGSVSALPAMKRHRQLIFWCIGLSVPISYFLLDFLGAVRIWVAEEWRPGLGGWLLAGGAVLLVSSVALCTVRLAKLQKFCRARLAPLGWVHVAVAIVALTVFWTRGVHLFQDYVHPGKALASDLPDVYLVTIDAFRAEDGSVYGYDRPTTPNLERFAQRASTFEFFFANSNFTTAGTTSIETGQLPWSSRVFHLGGFLRGEAQGKNLAELLRRQGYYTATISSNYYASPVRHKTLPSYDAAECISPATVSGIWAKYSNLIGLNTLQTQNGALLRRLAGVRRYLDALIWEDRYPSPAAAVFDRARNLLERPDIQQPRFVWMHILPPHDPYLAPLPYRKQFLSTNKLTRAYDFLTLRNDELPAGVSAEELRARYDESILYADHEVGEFIEWLDRSGRLPRSIVIISADHGESFEHHWFLHTGPYLYNSLIRVPLLIHLPGQTKGVRIAYPAQQVDLLPTVLDLVGAPIPNWAEGGSLKPMLKGEPMPERYLFSMNLEPNRTFDPITHGTVAVMDGEFKYLGTVDGSREGLYRYKTDQEERHDLIASEPTVAGRMRDVFHNKLREVNQQFTPQH